MTRVSQQQRSRTQNSPLILGNFNQTSLRVLTGTLGPLNQVVGRADTNQYSNGGFGGGTYNHWFQVNLTTPAWIITRKGGPRPNYIEVSVYDLNRVPKEGRMIFEKDSLQTTNDTDSLYYPYIGHVMGSNSYLYNNFNPDRLDKGNDLYFELEVGSYLICISTTRNEILNYNLALVIEISTNEIFILLEDTDGSLLTQETIIDSTNTVTIGPVFTGNYTIPSGSNAFSFSPVIVEITATITVSFGSSWFISTFIPTGPVANDLFIVEPNDNYNFNALHEHSRGEWLAAWRRENSPDSSLPTIFDPLISRA